jgi:hypothetical protein
MRHRQLGRTRASQLVMLLFVFECGHGAAAPQSAPAFEIFETASPAPDPSSLEYLDVSTVPRSGKVLLNNEYRDVIDVRIVGNTLRFDEDDSQHLLESFNGQKYIASLLIAADTVYISSPLRLPDCQLQIQARKIIFGTSKDGVPAFIDVSPSNDWQPSTPASKDGAITSPAHNGEPGHSAPPMSLFAHELEAKGHSTRLISRGSNGQNAGAGRNGDDGRIHMPQPGEPGYSGYLQNKETADRLELPRGTVYITTGGPNNGVSVSGEGGLQAWPDDGEDAQAAGSPGEPGDGGVISTNLSELTALVDLSAGIAGQTGKLAIGGAPGTPVEAKWVVHNGYHDDRVINSRTQIKGKDAAAPQPVRLVGEAGKIAIRNESGSSWIDESALQTILLYQRDLYTSGNYAEAETSIAVTLAALDASVLPDQGTPAVEAARLEMKVLSRRLSERLDYFGNAAGWAPMQSLEVSVSVFNSEIENAIKAMVTKRWLDERKKSARAKDVALQQAIAIDSRQVGEERDALARLQDTVVNLRQESRKLDGQTEQVKRNLRLKEQWLAAQARNHVMDKHQVQAWQSSLEEMGEICKIVPIYQPVLGQVGSGMISVAEFGRGDSARGFKTLSEIWRPETERAYEESSAELGHFVDAIDLKSSDSIQKRLQSLVPIATKIGKIVSILQKDAAEREVAQSEVDSELKRLRAQTPELDDLISQVAALSVQRELVGQLINKGVAQTSTVESNIVSSIVAVDSMAKERSALLDTDRPEIDLLFKRLDAEARDRLLKYHYLLAKAYEFRLVKKYSKRLKLDSMLDQMAKILAKEATLENAISDETIKVLKQIYVSNLEQITDELIRDLEETSGRQTIAVQHKLTLAELALLNSETGAVNLDLMSLLLIPDDAEDVRLEEVKITRGSISSSTQGESIANTRVRVEHSLNSKIRSRGKLYSFRQTVPAVWGATFHGLGEDVQFDPTKPTLSENTLLESLLGGVGGGHEQAIAKLRATPAAWSTITISKTSLPVSQSVDVENLELSFFEDYREAPTSESVLHILPTHGLAPKVVATDGTLEGEKVYEDSGEFFKVYGAGSQVTLSTPARVGQYRFVSWRDDSAVGPVRSMKTKISITMNSNKTLFTEYELMK